MNITHFFFDLDGTLVDSYPGIEYSIRLAIESFFPGKQLPDLRNFIGPPVRQIFSEILPGISSHELDRLVTRFRQVYDSYGWQKSFPYPGVIDSLGQLMNLGKRSFVVTNKPALPVGRILRKFELDKLVEASISPDSGNPAFVSKAEMLSFLLQQHRLDPNQCLFIGDSKDDVDAARACKMLCVPVAYGYGEAYLNYDERAGFVSILTNFNYLMDLIAIA